MRFTVPPLIAATTAAMRRIWQGVVAGALLLSGGAAWAQDSLSHGLFHDVVLLRPPGEVRSVALLLSGERGWDAQAQASAQALASDGALVAGISTPALLAALERDGGDCVSPVGDLENLSHYVQGYARLATYRAPLLVGFGSGAPLAYAMLAQAPADTFAGALTHGFCPQIALRKPLCGAPRRSAPGPDAVRPTVRPVEKLSAPWISLASAESTRCPVATAQAFVHGVAGAEWVWSDAQGDAHATAALRATYRRLATQHAIALPTPPATLGDLPIIEVAASTAVPASPRYAILLSGDGGWAGIDQEVARALAAQGVAVVGFDSLRYFWTPRTPQGLAQDLDRVIRHYGARWNRHEVILIGYSQGADVLPFALNRLPAATRAQVSRSVLMGPGENAAFEFHLSNWISRDDDARPIAPEARKLDGAHTLCLYGEAEAAESLCPKLSRNQVTAVALTGGHHFDGDYAGLARRILDGLHRAPR